MFIGWLMDVLLLTLGRRMSDERGGIRGSHKIFYIHTQLYNAYTQLGFPALCATQRVITAYQLQGEVKIYF